MWAGLNATGPLRRAQLDYLGLIGSFPRLSSAFAHFKQPMTTGGTFRLIKIVLGFYSQTVWGSSSWIGRCLLFQREPGHIFPIIVILLVVFTAFA